MVRCGTDDVEKINKIIGNVESMNHPTEKTMFSMVSARRTRARGGQEIDANIRAVVVYYVIVLNEQLVREDDLINVYVGRYVTEEIFHRKISKTYG